jgi:tetratricopeptide (TPR) repeat protein
LHTSAFKFSKDSVLMSDNHLTLAKRFWVDDLPGASVSGSRLSNLMETFSQGKPLSALGLRFLTENGLKSLAQFVAGDISESQFIQLAPIEQSSRVAAALVRQKAAEQQRQVEQEAAEARHAAMMARLHAERLQRESDPKFIARQRNRDLRERYGVDGFLDESDFRQLMAILRKLDGAKRLSEEDAVWLKSEGRGYATEEIVHAHNRLEADYYLGEFRKTGDVWQLVNASGHLRKCDAAREAHDLLVTIQDGALKQAKLRSAVRTTHGGVMRDLGRYNEALQLADEAHQLLPNSFRPCTLLGALNIEMGNISLGHEWYSKAEERGAKPGSIESEIRSLLGRMPPEKRDSVIGQLLSIDPAQYAWLRKKPAAKDRRRGGLGH